VAATPPRIKQSGRESDSSPSIAIYFGVPDQNAGTEMNLPFLHNRVASLLPSILGPIFLGGRGDCGSVFLAVL
jgi:hypothetical protein